MVISTSGIYQRNIDNFTRQSKEINDIQAQASSGKKDLSLADNLVDIDDLNASEDQKTLTMQFNKNATDVSSKMNQMDSVFDQLQNVTRRLMELQVQTASGFIMDSDRKLLGLEAAGIKEEFFQLANQVGLEGRGIFSGLSGKSQPFEMNNNGSVSYTGSGDNMSLQVSHDAQLRQNFSGDDIFLNLGSGDAKFSVFDAVDNFVEATSVPLGADKSSNLFSAGNSIELVFPEAGSASKFKFDLTVGSNSYSIDTTVYGNDYSVIASAINLHIAGTGLTATSNGTNKITLSGDGRDIKLENYSTDLAQNVSKSVGIRKTIGGATDDDYVIQHKLGHGEVSGQLKQVFEQFNKHQQVLAITARAADHYIESTQETLVTLAEDISVIKDADMARLLTKLQQLLTSKEAAQATFTRITSKSLFDFLS